MTTPFELLAGWVARQAEAEPAAWFQERLAAMASGEAAERDLHIVLGLAPRKLGKADLDLSEADLAAAEASRPGWRPTGWSVDGAARIAALLAFTPKRPFAETFKDLRRTADAAETVALYRGLPLYPEPESLAFEVGEGLRSNLKPVFEAVAHDNPFPRDHFDQHRWNHMVLKALFIGARLSPILGLDARANAELARILLEYADERRAAGRPISPELWRCVGPFAEDAAALSHLERALSSAPLEAAAAALALSASPAADAAGLLAGRPEAAEIAAGRLSWASVAAELDDARSPYAPEPA